MKSTTILNMFSATPTLHKRHNSGVNQYGMRPEKNIDYFTPSQLVNWGKATNQKNFNIRMGDAGSFSSAPSLEGNAVMPEQFRKRLGIEANDPNTLHFCSGETMSLRMCMARGSGACESELRTLNACLDRVRPLKAAINRAGGEWRDWFIYNVSDNYTKPLAHRTQDWAHQRAEFNKEQRRKQSGRKTNQRHSKQLGWFSERFRDPGYSKYPRRNINA